MELPQILYKLLPVFWWIAVWEVTETAISWLMSHKKESKFVFYIGMILIIAGILYWDKYALNHF
jgi:hypothetical protein